MSLRDERGTRDVEDAVPYRERACAVPLPPFTREQSERISRRSKASTYRAFVPPAQMHIAPRNARHCPPFTREQGERISRRSEATAYRVRAERAHIALRLAQHIAPRIARHCPPFTRRRRISNCPQGNISKLPRRAAAIISNGARRAPYIAPPAPSSARAAYIPGILISS